MGEDGAADTEGDQAGRLARAVVDRLGIEDGLLRAGDLADALGALVASPGGEPAPAPSCRSVVERIVAELRAREGDGAFVPTMEI